MSWFRARGGQKKKWQRDAYYIPQASKDKSYEKELVPISKAKLAHCDDGILFKAHSSYQDSKKYINHKL